MNPSVSLPRFPLFFFVSSLLLSAPGSFLAAPDRPNVLILVADDLGYSDLGCYGGEIASPHLDSLAAGGLQFTRFYTTGRCCPSRASLLTGQYPHRVGLGHMTQDLGPEWPGFRGRVSDDALTIAQVLRSAGYRTFLSGKWHLGTPDPTRHGFETFYGTLTSAKTFWDPGHFAGEPAPETPTEPGRFYGTDALTDRALHDLRTARKTTPGKPWFLYLAYHAPHFPLHAPPEDIARYAEIYQIGWDQLRRNRLRRMIELELVPGDTELPPRSPWANYGETECGPNPPWNSLPEDRRRDLARRMAIYAAMVDRMDRNIGRVLEELRATDQLENTLILFLSDNGACAEWDPHGFDVSSSNRNILHTGDDLEAMGSAATYHSVGSGWANASNTPWRLYKHYNHEGGIASPCILHWPARVDPGLEDTSAHLIDILPTLLRATGARYRGKLPLPGEDLLALPAEARPLFFEHEGHRALILGDEKLVSLNGRPWELYDLKRDRTELHDLAPDRPQAVDTLSALWNQMAHANFARPQPLDLNIRYLQPRSPW